MGQVTTQDAERWASILWTAVHDESGTVLGWHKRRVPYVPDGLSLQTLDVWVPASSSWSETPPAPDARPDQRVSFDPWFVYIHGGAWRDEKTDASSFSAVAEKLLARASTERLRLAGLASIDYRLSPRSTTTTTTDADPARMAKHPHHIADVRAGLGFLARLTASSSGPWALGGHSCGATLAFQAVMHPRRWGLGDDDEPTWPNVLVGLNGLYDLDGLIEASPAPHARLRDEYEHLTRGAFGGDRAVWRAVSPATAEGDWVVEWTGGGHGYKVVLVQSREDTLVPYAQLEAMRERLRLMAPTLDVQEFVARDDHDDLWKKGDRLADILAEILSALVEV